MWTFDHKKPRKQRKHNVKTDSKEMLLTTQKKNAEDDATVPREYVKSCLSSQEAAHVNRGLL